MNDSAGGPSKRPPPVPFGKYKLLREIGRGGKGVVHEALDTVLNRKVALKRIQAGSEDDAAEIAAEGRRFLIEARIGASLPRHPHIVGVYEAGEIDGQPYLAMELVPDQSLVRWRKTPAATFEAQAELLRDVALALDHAHTHGVVHRDVKPQNILVDAQGQPRLTDFGLARLEGQKEDLSLSEPGRIWGTPAYISPEHACGNTEVDARADVYSLGVLLYEAIAGRPPFKGETSAQVLKKVASDPPPPIASLLSASLLTPLQRALEPLCMKALSKDPDDRPASAAEFADGIDRCLDARRSRKKLAIASAAVAALLLVVVSSLFVFGGSKGPTPQELEAQKADEKRRHDQLAREKQKAVDEIRHDAEERAREKEEEFKRRLEVQRRASDEEAVRLKMDQIKAEERARAAEAAAAKKPEPKPAEPLVPLPTPAPAVAPPAPPAPAVKPDVAAPVAPKTAPSAPPSGEPSTLADGTLHWEAEEFSGGDKPVEGVDYHDSTPGNSGKAYRSCDVDVAGGADGTVSVVDASPGEWLRFRLQGGGRYQFSLRYLTRAPARVHLEVDGTNVTGPVALAPSPDRRTWVALLGPVVRLSPGKHELRFVFDTSLLGLDSFELKPPSLLPLPEAARLREAETSIRELFKADYANRSPSALQALAKKMLAEAEKLQDDPTTRFVLLSESRDLAAQAGDLAGSTAAIAALERAFEVDAPAMKAAALGLAARAARTPELAKGLPEGYLALIDQAAEADDFELALSIASKADAALRGTPNAASAARIQARAKQVAALRDEVKALEPSAKALQERPDDPAANLAVGLHRCFSRGDWAQGLPLLAKGSDPAVAAAAKAELEAPSDPVQLAATADAWREAGEKRMGALKTRCLSRAAAWYERALPGLIGFPKLKAEAQLESLSKAAWAESFKKGLVFWVEPGKDSQDPFRDHVAGVRATVNGGTVQDNGGRGLTFARKQSCAEYPASEAVKGVDAQGSIFAWIRHDKGDKLGCILALGGVRSDDAGLWADRGRLSADLPGVETKRRISSKGSVPTDRWILCGVTWDGSTVAFYIDGKEDTTLSLATGDDRRPTRLRIGNDFSGGQEFSGLIGTVMLYNRALTSQEALQCHLGTRGKYR